VLLVTPWLFLRWCRVLGRTARPDLAVLAGLVAAAGFWLKPHCLLAPLAIEGVVLVMTRDLRVTFRIENLAAIGFSVLYVAAVWLFADDFFTRMIPLGVEAYLPFYGPERAVAVGRVAVPLFLAATVFAGASFLSTPFRMLSRMLLAGGLALLVAYLLQAGFRYQILPALFFLALGAGLVLIDREGAATTRRRIAEAASAAGLLVLLGTIAGIQSPPYRGAVFEPTIAAAAPGARSIFIASTNVSDGFPLVEERGLIWASRFPTQWLAPYAAMHLDGAGAPVDDIARFALAATIDDLLTFQPGIVFINENPLQAYFKGPPLDFLRFWNKDPRFAPFWTHYRKHGVVDGFGAYVREAAAAPGIAWAPLRGTIAIP
jgi:hypothetical protein